MGFKLTEAALEVLAAAPPVGKRRQRAAEGSLSHIERLALVALANSARDDTGLAWPSQPTLAGIGGCSANAIGPALAALKAAGHISIMPGRRGRFPLYLVHPGGLADHSPLPLQTVRAHLSKGRFSPADQGDVVAWLAGLGRLGSEAACAAIRQAATRALSSRRKTPPTVGGVDGSELSPSPPNGCDSPPQRLRLTPPAIGDEPIMEPPIEPTARVTSSDIGQRERPADPQQGAIQGCATGIATPGAPAKALKRAAAFDWSGEPHDVLARLRAARGDAAARLEGMSETEALEAVARAQRQLVWHKSKPLRAA